MRALWGELKDANGTAKDDKNSFHKNAVPAFLHILGVDSAKKIIAVQRAIQTETGASCDKEVRFFTLPFQNPYKFKCVSQACKRKIETNENIQNVKPDADIDGKATKRGSGTSGIYKL